MTVIFTKLANIAISLCFLGIIFFFGLLSSDNLVGALLQPGLLSKDLKESIASIESYYNDSFYGKMHFINMNGFINRILQRREMNQIIRMNNDCLTFTEEEANVDDMKRNAQAVASFQQYVEDTYQGQVLYIQAPYKINPYVQNFPAGASDYSNQNMDVFLSFLNDFRVSNIDIRSQMYLEGLDPYSLFYRTDHHWTPQGGFFAYQKIAEWVEQHTDYTLPSHVQAYENYTVTDYPKWYLGSNGKRVGQYFAGVDDFQLLTPNFPTSITHNDQSTGSYEEILIDMTPLASIDYEHGYVYDNVYGRSLSGDFKNNDESVCGKRLLVISDSMGKVVNPFLIMSFREVLGLDVYGLGPDTVADAIDTFSPDLVIILLYAPNITRPYLLNLDPSSTLSHSFNS